MKIAIPSLREYGPNIPAGFGKPIMWFKDDSNPLSPAWLRHKARVGRRKKPRP